MLLGTWAQEEAVDMLNSTWTPGLKLDGGRSCPRTAFQAFVDEAPGLEGAADVSKLRSLPPTSAGVPRSRSSRRICTTQ